MDLSEFLWTACVLFGVVYLISKVFKSQKGRLPGPTALPLLGNALQIGYKPHLQFTKWSKVYGPIFGVKLATQEAFVVTDLKLIKELLSDHASAGRMLDNPVVLEFTQGKNGVMNSEGPHWEQQRRFTIKTLKNLGFAKRSMEATIMEEVQAVLKWFRKSNKTPIPGNRIFHAPVINSLWKIVSGESCDWEQGRPKIIEAAEEVFEALLTVSVNGVMIVPILRYIAPDFFGWNRYVKSLKEIRVIFEESVQQHKDTLDPTELRDFIDHFLVEVENETNPDSSFYKTNAHEQLVGGLLDLFLAGSETTSNTLSWSLLYLSEHPKIQENLQNEIDKVIGSRLPTLSDKNKMPYMEAFISEILRKTSLVPLAIPHRMLSDKVFNGYLLKKGTPFFVNLYGVHHDKDIWGDPDTFRPERFLSEDGSKYVRNPALIPFSDGKRICPGEHLAKDSVFLFMTSILHEFTILPESSNKVADYDPEFGLISCPKPFKIVMAQRKDTTK